MKIEKYDLQYVPKKYKNMTHEEKKKCFQTLNKQMNLGLLNNYEIGEFIGLCYILLKEDGFFKNVK